VTRNAAGSKRPRLTPGRARRESGIGRKRRTAEILRRLLEEYPESHCALIHGDALELLVATILSAQCTDKRVNMVTPALFARYPDAASYAAADIGELEEMVRSTGFYRNKARSLKRLGEALVAEHDGQVPQTIQQLVKLPGVGRKTANVVLGNAFGIEVGVVVDTHVGRISRKLALTAHNDKDAVRIERDLINLVPEGNWTIWSHLLIDHGRAICDARRPQCGSCVLADLCPSAEI
jgi:endonuclease-3